MCKNAKWLAIALVLGGVLSLGACNTEDTPAVAKVSGQSDIIPAPLLLPGLKPIALLEPLSGTGVSVLSSQANSLALAYRADVAKYAALFIFSDVPQVENGAIKNLSSVCVGGATNIAASHAFSLKKSTLSSVAGTSSLYACQVNSLTDAFSVTDKLLLTPDVFVSGKTYYWAVLGYDEHFHLGYSSSLREFIVE